MIVAIASTDGETVNEHFGRTDRFLIYDISGDKHSLLEVRKVTPLSNRDKKHTFNAQRMSNVLESVKECKLVYCTKIGDRPRQELEKIGITTVVGKQAINEISLEE